MGDKPPRIIAYDGNEDCQYLYRMFGDMDYEYTEFQCFPAKKIRHITEAEETEYGILIEGNEYECF